MGDDRRSPGSGSGSGSIPASAPSPPLDDAAPVSPSKRARLALLTANDRLELLTAGLFTASLEERRTDVLEQIDDVLILLDMLDSSGHLLAQN